MVKISQAVFYGIFLLCFNSGGLAAQSIDLYDNVSFKTGDNVYADEINVNSSLFVENHGTLNADIFVCGACDFYLRNDGIFSGQIYLADGASMTQVVLNGGDVTALDVDGSYTVVALGARGLVWDDLMSVAAGADSLVVRDSEVLMGGDNVNLTTFALHEPVIEFQGVVTIRLDDAYEYSYAPVVRNVHGGGTVVVTGGPPLQLYAVSPQMRGSDLYINLVRETDYYKILGNESGHALNNLRARMPDASLLQKLDEAPDMGALYDVMSRSVALNPFMMTSPVRLLNDFMKNDGMVGVNHVEGAGAPFYISASDFNIYGAMAGVDGIVFENLRLHLGAYGAKLDYHDDINDYRAEIYGGNISFDYGWHKMFWRALVGASYALFDVPYVVMDDLKFGDVHAITTYGATDSGLRFGVGDFVRFAPYIGFEYDYAELGRDDDLVFNGRAGFDAGLCYEGVDLRYEYSGGVVITDSGKISAGTGVGMWSAADGAGIDAGVNMIRDNGTMSYMFKISLRIGF